MSTCPYAFCILHNEKYLMENTLIDNPAKFSHSQLKWKQFLWKILHKYEARFASVPWWSRVVSHGAQIQRRRAMKVCQHWTATRGRSLLNKEVSWTARVSLIKLQTKTKRFQESDRAAAAEEGGGWSRNTFTNQCTLILLCVRYHTSPAFKWKQTAGVTVGNRERGCVQRREGQI